MPFKIDTSTAFQLIACAISATLLVNGLLLKAAAAISKEKIHFGFAMLVALAASIASGMITFTAMYVLYSPAEAPGGFMMSLMYAPGIITGLIITAVLCRLIIVDAEGKKIPFGKGLRIATIQLAFTFGLVIVAGVLYLLLTAS